jgi:hypothetical protein
MKSKAPTGQQSRSRLDFFHELQALSVFLRHYQEYFDDFDFRFPVKQRHRVSAVLKKVRVEKAKDVRSDEFSLFEVI